MKERTGPPVLRGAAALVAVVWLNVYISREFFSVGSTAQMNSMHGFWAAMARWAGSAWWVPTWWPYWDGGMPFEYTYAPLVPGLAALIARTGGISELRAIHILMGLVFALGPALLCFALWRLTRSAAWSLAAAVAYSLLSPALLVAPNQSFSLAEPLSSERLYLIAAWDELPHMGALALWPVAVLCLFRMLETRRVMWVAGGALVMAAMVYTSAFGATLLAISALCAIAAAETDWRGVGLVGIAGAATYLASAIALPPSLIGLIREAAEIHGHGWSVKSWAALAAVAMVWAALVPWLRRRVADAYLRFFLLFTATVLAIVWLYQYAGRQFIPQPGRYKLELSLGLAVTGVLAARPLFRRFGRPLQAALLALLVALAAEQVIEQRRWAKNILRGKDITQTIEYRAARWMDAHLAPDARVMLPGSMAQWLNAFSERTQWTGSSWATAVNPLQQRAVTAVYAERGDIEGSLTWFRAFGVQAVAVSGPHSPEFWKPFEDKTRYDGKLDVLWDVDDTRIYRVPLRTASLAHAVPEGARSTEHWDGIRRYVAALDAERLQRLSLAWTGRNRATVRGEVRRGEAVSVQVTHHAGWSAKANGRSVPIERDGIGLMWIRPGCDGPCTVELSYGGGAELVLCRVVSGLALCGLVLLLLTRGGRSLAGGRFRRAFRTSR